MGIVDDIMDGTATSEDILKNNIRVMESFIAYEKTNKHPADKCNRKYCHHGDPNHIRALEDHLDFLKSELQENPESQKDE